MGDSQESPIFVCQTAEEQEKLVPLLDKLNTAKLRKQSMDGHHRHKHHDHEHHPHDHR